MTVKTKILIVAGIAMAFGIALSSLLTTHAASVVASAVWGS